MERGRRLAVAVITGDKYHSDEVQKMLGSVAPHAQGIFVSYNGKKSRFPRWAGMANGLQVSWGRSKWTDDFSAARAHSFSLVPRDRFDWILWIDTDDRLVAPDGLDPVFDSLDEYTQGVFLRYAYAIEPETDEVVVEQWRERILSTQWPWEWKWPIHECAVGPPGTQFAKREEAWIEHLRRSGEDRGARERNRRIISRAMRERPEEPRYLYYFANEALAEATEKEPGLEKDSLCDAAIAQYRKFLQAVAHQQTDDVYAAAVRIGDLYALKGDLNGAIDAYLQAVKFYPNWPDAYVGIAKACMEMGDFPRMKEFAGIAANISKPITSAAIEPMSSSFHPVFLRGIGREETGDLEGALSDYRQAIAIWRPPNGSLDEKIEELEKRVSDAAGVPDSWDVRKEHRGTRSEKSVCFFTNPLPEVWNYETLATTGHGGSETLVLQLAEMFAADGWRSVIFGMPGHESRGMLANGVEMYNYDEWLPNEPFTAFVSSRAGDPFTAPINAKAKLLWMHDVNAGPNAMRIMRVPDAVVALTGWHGRHLQKLYGLDPARIAVVPNGVDMSKFPIRESWEDDPEAPRFIWGSSPDRGLETLISLWPAIRNAAPRATLDIYYGWAFVDKLIEHGAMHLVMLKNRIVSAVEEMGGEEGGIFWRDRVPQDQLIEAAYGSEYWAYPTQFLETFCLTAVMLQAAGVIPICSDLAGLRETVGCKWYTLEGWPLNADYQSRFIALVNNAISPQAKLARMRASARSVGRRHAEMYSADAAYAAWNELFALMGVRVPAAQVVLG